MNDVIQHSGSGNTSSPENLNQSGIERLHYMDSMRAILMMLGVVFHSAYVYIPEVNFLISSTHPVDYAKPLAAAIHAFRMEAFFVVAGFFCVLTLKKYGCRKFLQTKTFRILIPLIVTGVTLNSLQQVLVTNYTMTAFSMQDYLSKGRWVSHLWFLFNLLVYFLVAAMLVYIVERPLARIGRWINRLLVAIPMLFVIFLMPIATLGVYGMKRAGLPLDSHLLGMLDTSDLLLYLPYFIFGSIIASEEKLLWRFSTISPAISVTLLAAAYYTMKFAERLSHFAETVALVYLSSLSAWLGTALCFYVFRTFFNKQSAMWLFLSDASYTIYLFHMIVVVSVGIVLIRLEVNGYFALPILITITTCVTLAIHAFVIRNFRAARMLYNGK